MAVNLGNVSTHNNSVDVAMTFTNDGLAVPQELGTHSVAKGSSDIHTDHSKGDMVGITSDEGTTTKMLFLLTLQLHLLCQAM